MENLAELWNLSVKLMADKQTHFVEHPWTGGWGYTNPSFRPAPPPKCSQSGSKQFRNMKSDFWVEVRLFILRFISGK